jgi:hypothetical protein
MTNQSQPKFYPGDIVKIQIGVSLTLDGMQCKVIARGLHIKDNIWNYVLDAPGLGGAIDWLLKAHKDCIYLLPYISGSQQYLCMAECNLELFLNSEESDNVDSSPEEERGGLSFL